MGRFLAVPAVLLLILLVVLGAQSESAEQYRERVEQDQSGSSGTGSSGESGSSSGADEGGETRYRYDENADPGADQLDPPTRISIDTPNGRIAFEPAGTVNNDGITWDIDEPLPGRLVGFRQAIGGDFFVVQRGLEQPGDVLISWFDDQLVLTEVDGGITSIRRNDSVLAGTFTLVDGTVMSFESEADEPVVVSDRLQAEPEDVGPVFGTDPSDPFKPPVGSSWPWGWIGLGTALTMFCVGMWLIFKDGIGLATVHFTVPQHTNVTREGSPGQEDDLFARLSQSEDADAVVRELYELAVSGSWGIEARHSEETPLEYHWRVRDRLPPSAAQQLGQLTDLYSAVQFAPQTATLDDRDRAIGCAKQLLLVMSQAADRQELGV